METTDSAIRVLVVDDHPLLREGVAAMIDGESDMRLVAEASDGDQAIDAYRRYMPDVVLMDLQMPKTDGVAAIRAICGEFDRARIVVLTTYDGDVQAVRAVRAGAVGYLLKTMLRRDLLDTIRVVHQGRRCLPPSITALLAAHAADDDLTPRETDILRLVAEGLSNKSAAERLAISEETVKAYLKNVFVKLGANDRTHAVTIALKRGIIAL